MKIYQFKRAVHFLLCVGLVTFLTACSGNQLINAGDAKKSGEVYLGASGIPVKADLLKAGPLGDKSLGNANAPITVIEYMSLTCPHCRAFHQKTFATV